MLCQKLLWSQGWAHCCKHWMGSLEEHGPGLTVFALNMEENVSELMLLKHSGLYLAVIKADKVSGWKNGLNLNATADGSSEELMS